MHSRRDISGASALTSVRCIANTELEQPLSALQTNLSVLISVVEDCAQFARLPLVIRIIGDYKATFEDCFAALEPARFNSSGRALKTLCVRLRLHDLKTRLLLLTVQSSIR